MNDEILLRLLREAQARTPSGAFEQLLTSQINIPPGIRQKASTSQQHLREFLSSECGRDSTFPRILSTVDDDFIGGSFARHVKNWPLDDIDIFFPLDGHNLVYHSSGARLPHSVLSDGVLRANPLLTPRWMDGENISSIKLINEFAGVLRRHYSEQEVMPDGQAVTVRMKQGESETGDGLGFDIVPCFSLQPDSSQEQPFYLIPNGSGGWIRTNPRLDQEVSDRLHENNEKTFRKAVKLLKFWNTEQFGGLLSSYYIELAVARTFSTRNNQAETIRSIPYAVALGLVAVNEAVIRGSQTSWLAEAPPVEPGDLTDVHRKYLAASAGTARDAWTLEMADQMAPAIRAWGQVFGPKFNP